MTLLFLSNNVLSNLLLLVLPEKSLDIIQNLKRGGSMQRVNNEDSIKK